MAAENSHLGLSIMLNASINNRTLAIMVYLKRTWHNNVPTLDEGKQIFHLVVKTTLLGGYIQNILCL